MADYPYSYWDEASARADRLLWSRLTEAQRRTFGNGYFDVRGSRGGRYRICTSGTVHNIKGRGIFRKGVTFCVTPRAWQPRGDVWLSQKLLIEADEDLFRRVAIRSLLGY